MQAHSHSFAASPTATNAILEAAVGTGVGRAYSWEGCLATLLCGVGQIQQHSGYSRGVLNQGVIVSAILLTNAVAQNLHVFLMTDVQVSPRR